MSLKEVSDLLNLLGPLVHDTERARLHRDVRYCYHRTELVGGSNYDVVIAVRQRSVLFHLRHSGGQLTGYAYMLSSGYANMVSTPEISAD